LNRDFTRRGGKAPVSLAFQGWMATSHVKGQNREGVQVTIGRVSMGKEIVELGPDLVSWSGPLGRRGGRVGAKRRGLA